MLRLSTIAALLVLATAARASGADAGAPRGCGGDAWSYAIARDRSAPDGRYAVGPQTFCAEVERHDAHPPGPIGIVIDPFSDRPAPARPVPPIPDGVGPGFR